MMNDNLSRRISPYEASWRLGSEHRRSSTAIRTHILSLEHQSMCLSRGGDMEFLRGSTDSQWSCLYIHHLLLASAVRQFITKDMAVRSKLAAWIWALQEQWDDTRRYTLSRAPEYIWLSLPTRARAISPIHSCRVRLIQGTQKFDDHHIIEQSSAM